MMTSIEHLQRPEEKFSIKLNIDPKYAESSFSRLQPFIEIMQNNLDAMEAAWLGSLCVEFGLEFNPAGRDFAIFAESALKYSHMRNRGKEGEELPEIEFVGAEIDTEAIKSYIEVNPRKLPRIIYYYQRENGEGEKSDFIEIEHGDQLDNPENERQRLVGIRFEDTGRGYDKNVLQGMGLTTKDDISWNRGGLGEGAKVGFNRLCSAGCEIKLGSTNSAESWDAVVKRNLEDGQLEISGIARPVDPAKTTAARGSYTEVWFPPGTSETQSISVALDPIFTPGIEQQVFEYCSWVDMYPGDNGAMVDVPFTNGLFVRGLRITDAPAYLASYNIGNKYAIIGRDRAHVDQEILNGIVKNCLLTHNDPRYAQVLVDSISSPESYQELELFWQLQKDQFNQKTLECYVDAFRRMYPTREGKKTIFYSRENSAISIQREKSAGHRMQLVSNNSIDYVEFLASILPDEIGLLADDHEQVPIESTTRSHANINQQLSPVNPILKLLGIKSTIGTGGQANYSSTVLDACLQLPITYGKPFPDNVINVKDSPLSDDGLPNDVYLSHHKENEVVFIGNSGLDHVTNLALMTWAGARMDKLRSGKDASRDTQVALGETMTDLLNLTQPGLFGAIRDNFARLDLGEIPEPLHPLSMIAYKPEDMQRDFEEIALASMVERMNMTGSTRVSLPTEIQDRIIRYPHNRFAAQTGLIYPMNGEAGFDDDAREAAIIPVGPDAYTFETPGQTTHVRVIGGMPFGRSQKNIIPPYSSSHFKGGVFASLHNGGILSFRNHSKIAFIENSHRAETNYGKDRLYTNLDVKYGNKIWDKGGRVISDIIQNHRDASPDSRPEIKYYLRNLESGEELCVGLADMDKHPIEAWEIVGLQVEDDGEGYVTSNLTTLGQSSKRSGDSGGIHGEGLKMMIISCLRNGIDVELASLGWVATPEIGSQQVMDYTTETPFEYNPLEFKMAWQDTPRTGSMTRIGLPKGSPEDSNAVRVWKQWASGFDPRIADNVRQYQDVTSHSNYGRHIVDVIPDYEGVIFEHGGINEMQWPEWLLKPVLAYNFNTNLSDNRERTHLSPEIVCSALEAMLPQFADVESIKKIMRKVKQSGKDSLETKILGESITKMTPAAKSAWRLAYYEIFGNSAVLSDMSELVAESYLPPKGVIRLPLHANNFISRLVNTMEDYQVACDLEDEIELTDSQRFAVADSLNSLTHLVLTTFEYGLENHPSLFDSSMTANLKEYLTKLKEQKPVFKIVNSASLWGEIDMAKDHPELKLNVSLLSNPEEFVHVLLHEVFHYVSRSIDYTRRFEHIFAAFIALRYKLAEEKFWLVGNMPNLEKP